MSRNGYPTKYMMKFKVSKIKKMKHSRPFGNCDVCDKTLYTNKVDYAVSSINSPEYKSGWVCSLLCVDMWILQNI